MQGLRSALGSVGPGCENDVRSDDVSEALAVSAVRDAVDPGLAALELEIGFTAPANWRVASRYFHERFGALVDLSPVAARCFHKPLGYAGDFEMMNMVYRNESLGSTLFGRSLSRVVLDSEVGRAVRHRARYLVEKIEAAVTRGGRCDSRRPPNRPSRGLGLPCSMTCWPRRVALSSDTGCRGLLAHAESAEAKEVLSGPGAGTRAEPDRRPASRAGPEGRPQDHPAVAPRTEQPAAPG
jgi:hypothetical protein